MSHRNSIKSEKVGGANDVIRWRHHLRTTLGGGEKRFRGLGAFDMAPGSGGAKLPIWAKH